MRGRRRARAVAAKDGANSRDQFAAAERLRHIVVGAEFQSDDAIDLVALGGDHDDRDVGFGAQRAAQRQPVFARQHEIEQDEVDARVGQRLAHGFAVAGAADAKAVLDERARHQFAHLSVIVDDQDMRPIVHEIILASGSPRRRKKL